MNSIISDKRALHGLSLKSISIYRNELFGISILTIMIFHFFEENEMRGITEPEGMYVLMTAYSFLIKQMGVDVFVFLSGVGLYFSMNKTESLKSFYARRLRRVLPAYFAWCTLYWAVKDFIICKTSVACFILDLSLISFWTKGVKDLWYVTFIVACYLLYPAVYKTLQYKNLRLFQVFLMVSFICICVIYTMFPYVYSNIEIALWRLPVFMVGAYYGQRIYNNNRIEPLDYALIVSAILLKFIQYLVLTDVINQSIIKALATLRFVNCMFAFALMWFFVCALSFLHNSKLNNIFRKIGSISLELYITHITIRSICDLLGVETFDIMNYLLIVINSFIVSIVLHFAVCKKYNSSLMISNP